MVIQLSHEGSVGRLAQLRGILAFNLLRAVFQDDRCNPAGDQPLRNVVTFRVDRLTL